MPNFHDNLKKSQEKLAKLPLIWKEGDIATIIPFSSKSFCKNGVFNADDYDGTTLGAKTEVVLCKGPHELVCSGARTDKESVYVTPIDKEHRYFGKIFYADVRLLKRSMQQGEHGVVCKCKKCKK